MRSPYKKVIGVILSVAIAGGGIAIWQNGGGSSPPAIPTANIWVDSDGGTCTDNASPVVYSDAAACGSIDAANDTCDNGDIVYVKTASAYAGETISGTNSRTSVCTIEAEPSTTDIQFSGDFTFGTNGGNGPDFLTIKHVQCGSNNTSFTNGVHVNLWDDSNDITLDDFDCPWIDAFGADNLTIQNSDLGPCGSSASRSCITRWAPGQTNTNNTGLVVQDTTSHDIWCGTGNATDCGSFHTDGFAIFGGDQITFRRVKFYKNDITNIRFQTNSCGVAQGCTVDPNRPVTNVTIENSWFGGACATTAGTNCTGGLNANAFDDDNGISGFIVRFNSFQQDTRPQCNGPNNAGTECGSGVSNAQFLGNIYSTNASFCGYTKVTMTYNAENHWNGSSDSVCSGTGNNMGANVSYVTGTGIIDFHLSGTNNADSRVTSGCIATDIDGQSRSSTCDAGSDER